MIVSIQTILGLSLLARSLISQDLEYRLWNRQGFPVWLLGIKSDFYVNGCVSDVSSFVVNLQGRRDATFFLCGEVCRFISKLCSRCHLLETIPVENAWFLLLGFAINDGKFLTEEDFLNRLRLVNKVATASKQSAEVVHLNQKSEKAAIDKTADEATSSFAFISYNTF